MNIEIKNYNRNNIRKIMGSRPSAPVTYRPTPTAPTIYQSVIPEADYTNLSNYVSELKAEREKKKDER